MTHYSLAHPEKTFVLTSGPSELLHVTPVATRKERVYQVFGSQVLDELVDIGTREKEIYLPPPSVPASEAIAEYRREPGPDDDPPTRTFRLSGFFSRPQVQKGNRNSIYIFVNGRLIRDRLLLHALSSAYHNLMPASAYPFALLFLECDAEEVDVNVHPSKTEVRFRHGIVRARFRARHHSRAADGKPPRADVFAPRRASVAAGATRRAAALFRIQPDDREPGAGAAACSWWSGYSEDRRRDSMRSRAGRAALARVHPAPRRRPRAAPRFQRAAARSHARAAAFRQTLAPAGSPTASFRRRPSRRPRCRSRCFPICARSGQIHESFIIAAGRDGLWIIDQHVAHERILFEQVMKQRAAGRVEMQRLLMPLILQLTPEQQIDYARIADELHASGFETEPFGNRTIAVKAAPADVGAADLEKILFEILEIAEGELRGASLDDLRRSICASIACRAAIKINMRLDAAKMEWLLRALAATDCPMSCPHGRPIAMHYSTREILKAFHRI